MTESHLVPFLNVLLGLLVIAIGIFFLWVLPISLGIQCARRKNYPAVWMLFGIHPLGGWIAFIVLSCLQPRIACPNCGGFIKIQFRICPYCHGNVGGPMGPVGAA